MKKILLFGGSFDPIHNGHITIAQMAKEEIGADELVFIPSRAPRWKTPNATDKERLDMCYLALESIKGAKISLIEMESTSQINYTYTTILSYPKNDGEELYYLIGYDQLEQLNKWYEIDKLSELVHFVCYNRPSYKAPQEFVEKYHVTLLKSTYLSTMSSTKARECCQLDLPFKVLKYIEDNNLYYIKKIKSYLSERRFNHIISVANLAYEVALKNDVDPNKAYLAALLHDVGKEIPMQEQKAFMEANYPNYVEKLTPPLYHQFISYQMAKDIFKVDDEEILEAIKYHATGNSSMSVIGKIVYASDKVEPTRKFDTKPYTDALKKDIESGFRFVLDANIEFLKEHHSDFENPLTKACIETYLRKE